MLGKQVKKILKISGGLTDISSNINVQDRFMLTASCIAEVTTQMKTAANTTPRNRKEHYSTQSHD